MIGHELGIARKTVDPFLEKRQWKELDTYAQAAIEFEQPTNVQQSINNVQRTVGARMGGWIAERFGNYTLKPGLLRYTYTGIAGQSFGAFTVQGMELKLIGSE
jgi:glutamate synthase (NADPH/NADH) large chain